MDIWRQAVIRLTLLLTTSTLTATNSLLPDITDQTFINNCVREHNQNRSSVKPLASNMRYMSWDEGLAVTARAWARKCLFEHNTYLKNPERVHPVFRSVGENLWAGTTFSLQGAIQSWVEEVYYYNYKTQSCTNVCGHYTQVVWAQTYKVGCAVQDCPNGVVNTHFFPRPAVIFVCNYATAKCGILQNGKDTQCKKCKPDGYLLYRGNYKGQAPYIAGNSCSQCDGEKCENNLCRNSTRDALKRYNWTPDWDPALLDCGSFCKAILIIRPVSLFIIFSCVYSIQLCYPNIFAYTF